MTSDDAWLAGLLEGEGCFALYANRHGTRRPRVTVKMADRDVVARVAERFGVAVVLCRLSKPGWSDMYQVRLCGAKAEECMRVVLPLMGARRAAKIQEIFSLGCP
jgi:hypothetical protein